MNMQACARADAHTHTRMRMAFTPAHKRLQTVGLFNTIEHTFVQYVATTIRNIHI